MTTSKTKQFCETSSVLQVDNIKKRSNSARLPSKKGKVGAELTASYQYVLRFFHSTRLEYCASHEKIMLGHTVLHLSRKIIFHVHNPLRLPRKTTFERPKVLRTRQFFYTFDFEMCFAPQLRTLFQHLNFQKCSEPVSFLHFWLRNVLRATMACTFSTSQLPEVFWTRQLFTLLTSKCASRRNDVHFFDITTSKNGPNMVCFVHFDFQMCFTPQRRATFHLSSGRIFSRTCIFFLLTLSLSLTLATSAFPSVHIVGSLTSKLPSINI